MMKEHAGEIRLAIIDMVMPKLDGLQILEQIRQTRADLKVILNSGDLPPEGVDWLRSKSNLSFLAKPFSLRGLANLVRERLDA